MKSTRNLILGFVGGVVFLIGCDLSTDSGVTNKVVAATESLWENVGTTIYYTAGKVGIGTDTPETELHIDSSSGSTTLMLESSYASDDNILDMKDSDGDSWNLNVRGSTYDDFVISVEGIGNYLTIKKDSGNVGIGTLSPTQLLDVKNVLVVKEDDAQSATDSGGGVAVLGYFDVRRNHDYYKAARISQQGLGNILEIGTTDDGTDITYENKMLVTQQGHVGIGNDQPLSKLAVSGLPTSAPDNSGNAGVVCVTNDGNFWLDSDGTADCN